MMFRPRHIPVFAFSILFGWSSLFAQSRTTLVVQNNTTSDTQVFVVLAALGGACNSNNPPITAAQLQAAGFCDQVVDSPSQKPYAGRCQFTLPAGQSKSFPNVPNTCISGNVTFGAYPGCPNPSFPTGYTTAEFTLNPSVGAEDVDMSLVNGYNLPVTIAMSGGGGWVVSNTTQAITQIVAKPLGQNIGNPGVYPENCTDCIRLVGNPVCPGFPANPTCQATRICDAQRAVSSNGGTVTIALQPSAPAPSPNPSCSQILPLQQEIAANNARYNKLTGNRQRAERLQLKEVIAAELQQLNQAFASCGTCGRIRPLQAQIAADHAKYNRLTGKKQAAERQELKAQITQEQSDLQQAIASCPPCQQVAALQAQIAANNAKYNQMTGKNSAGARQQLKALIISEQNELKAIQPGCIVPISPQ